MNYPELKIVIAEPSVIIRSGLAITLKRLGGFHVQVSELNNIDPVNSFLKIQRPDILIINPVFWGILDLKKLKAETGLFEMKCFAILSGNISDDIVKHYDDSISIFDTPEILTHKIEKLFQNNENEPEENDVLSPREKEIMVCVVKGLTNKEIANELFLSAHTVISHRRNIARKLEIHSTAGLTVYAIMNKLIELDDIKAERETE